jgi:hypothetical protein
VTVPRGSPRPVPNAKARVLSALLALRRQVIVML